MSINVLTSLFPPLAGNYGNTDIGAVQHTNIRRGRLTSMMTIEERMMLRLLTKKLLQEETPHRRIDISNRKRDDLGRFLPNESVGMQLEEYELPLDDEPRKMKLVKVDGTYGTYEVKDRIIDGKLVRTLLELAGILTLVRLF
jgi:hypothetical protein